MLALLALYKQNALQLEPEWPINVSLNLQHLTFSYSYTDADI